MIGAGWPGPTGDEPARPDTVRAPLEIATRTGSDLAGTGRSRAAGVRAAWRDLRHKAEAPRAEHRARGRLGQPIGGVIEPDEVSGLLVAGDRGGVDGEIHQLPSQVQHHASSPMSSGSSHSLDRCQSKFA
jgi:hypothetical protein